MTHLIYYTRNIRKYFRMVLFLCVLSVLCGESTFAQEDPVKAFGVTERKVFLDTNGVPYRIPVMKSGLTNVKLKKTNGADSVSGVEIGSTGVYQFDFTGHTNIGSHYWRMYIDYTLKQEFGMIQMGTALMTDGTLPMQGELNMNNFRINNLGDPVSGIDAVNLSYLQANYRSNTAADTVYVRITGTQNITGSKTFSGTLTTISGSELRTSTATQVNLLVHADGSNYPKVSNNGAFINPTLSTHIATKGYVDDQVAGIENKPYQESVNLVRLMPGQSVQTNQIYNNYTNAANSFTSPSVTRQCAVFIPGTGNTIQYVDVPTNSLRNYVNTITVGKHVNLIVGTPFGGSASVTKTTGFENATIWLGANDIPGDRTFDGFTFKNCDIYAYKNVTFTNCTLINVNVFQPSTQGVTFAGSTASTGCNFYQTLTLDGGFTGTVTSTFDQTNYSFTMPTDPSVSGSEE